MTMKRMIVFVEADDGSTSWYEVAHTEDGVTKRAAVRDKGGAKRRTLKDGEKIPVGASKATIDGMNALRSHLNANGDFGFGHKYDHGYDRLVEPSGLAAK